MASPNIYANGIGATTGSSVGTDSSLYTTGYVWYVDSNSATGADAASPAGRQSDKPLLTLAQAVTNAAAGDVIVLAASHEETITSAITLSSHAGLTIIGQGTAGTRPKLTYGGAADLIVASSASLTLDNIYFPASTVVPTGRLIASASDLLLKDCYFECGALDTGTTIKVTAGADSMRIKSTSFVSTSTDTANQPGSAINVTGAVSDFTLDSVVVDGGTVGWQNTFSVAIDAAITRLKGTSLQLLNGSDVDIVTGTTGRIGLSGASGSSYITWAA